MFSVAQTKARKNGKPLLTVVPSLWVEDKYVYWPPNGLVTLSKNAESTPDKTVWKKSKAQILGQARTYPEAEELLAEYQKQSDLECADSEEAGGPSKPKKGKFTSNQYELVPLAVNQPIAVQPKTECIPHDTVSCLDKMNFTFARLPNGQMVKVLTDVPGTTGAGNVIQKSLEYVVPESSVMNKVNLNESQASLVHLGEVSYVQTMNETHLSDNVATNPCCEIGDVIQRINKLQESVTSVQQDLEDFKSNTTPKLDAILRFAANFDKFLSKKSLNESGKPNEDFGDCLSYLTVVTIDDLILLEKRLADDKVESKLIRYLKSAYDLSGKREGKSIFYKFMRATIPPVCLLDFSWKGQKHLNRSFKDTFPKFVNLVCRLIKLADYNATDESTHTLFSNFLRHKRTNYKRFGQHADTPNQDNRDLGGKEENTSESSDESEQETDNEEEAEIKVD